MAKRLAVLAFLLPMLFSICSCGAFLQAPQSSFTPGVSHTHFQKVIPEASAAPDTTENAAYSSDETYRELYQINDSSFANITVESTILADLDGNGTVEEITILASHEPELDYPHQKLLVSIQREDGTNSNALVSEDFVYGFTCTLADLDGEEGAELIIHMCVAISGGAGGYTNKIYTYRAGEVAEIFSDYDTKNNLFDTGFTGVFVEDWQLRVANKYTKYSAYFSLKGTEESEYFSELYTNDGKILSDKYEMMCDSFYIFEPVDYDGDGVYEIDIEQYTSMRGHADGQGYALSILKYYPENKEWKIVKSSFVQEYDINNLKWWENS